MAWKFEFFNNLGEKTFKYWQNDIDDDFLRYIPEFLLTTPESFQDPIGSGNWTIYAFDKSVDKLYDNYVWERGHRLNLETPGALIFERHRDPFFTPGEQVEKNHYLLKKKEFEEIFKLELPDPEWHQDKDELGNSIEQPYAKILESDPLANSKTVFDAGFSGVKLLNNPYDKNDWGKNSLLEFKGNFETKDKDMIKNIFLENKDGLRLINKYVLKM